MLLYTLVPLEQIFDEDDMDNKPRKKRRTLEVGKVMLEVEESNDAEYEIVKLISSNPADYLNTKYQPGNKIALKPQVQ